jgi:dipeptide/tripeptide permease
LFPYFSVAQNGDKLAKLSAFKMEREDHLEQLPSLTLRAPSHVPVPTAVSYLVCHEFLQRYSWKGMQVVLVLFLLEHFRLSEDLSTELVHIFLFIMNISPILGAILGDGYLVRILVQLLLN